MRIFFYIKIFVVEKEDNFLSSSLEIKTLSKKGFEEEDFL